jgi:hypothetical protein
VKLKRLKSSVLPEYNHDVPVSRSKGSFGLFYGKFVGNYSATAQVDTRRMLLSASCRHDSASDGSAVSQKKGRSLTRATRLYFGGQRASLKQGA